MKQNPCRYCVLSYVRNGKHYQSYRNDCYECENRKKHEEYLKSKRKFEIGEKIESLEELLKQQYVFCGQADTAKHIEAVKSWQLRIVLNCIESGSFYKAARKESEEK